MDVTEKWLLEVQERNVEVGRGEMRTHPGGVSGYNPAFLCGVFLLLKKKSDLLWKKISQQRKYERKKEGREGMGKGGEGRKKGVESPEASLPSLDVCGLLDCGLLFKAADSSPCS